MPIRWAPAAGGLFLALALMTAAAPAYALGDATRGQKIFQEHCSACHSIIPGANLFGPSLADIYGKPAAGVIGYIYSVALTEAHLTWDAAALDKFLVNPQTDVPGTKMPFIGYLDSTQRADVIAYLAEIASNQK